MIRDAESSALNSSLGAPFALVKKFGNNRLKSSFIPNFFTNTKLPPQFLEFVRATPKATNTRIYDLDSANQTQIAESATFCHSERSEESKNNPSLRADSQNLRGKPPLKKTQNLQNGLPRSHSLARNDGFLDSLLRKCSAQNDKVRAWNDGFLDSSVATLPQNDNVRLVSALSTHEANSAIADEFLGLCEASDKDRTQVHRGSEPKHSLKSRCESEFALDSAILQNQFFPAKQSLRLAESRKTFLPNTALIALGANLKNPIATFKSLFTKLARNAKIHILSTSPIYKNPPFGYANQPFFYNATILLATKMCLLEFYAFIFYLERIFGRNRKRAFKNAPRTLDIDIIFFNDIFMRSKKLNIPHPSWQTRASVLVPLIFQVHYKGF